MTKSNIILVSLLGASVCASLLVHQLDQRRLNENDVLLRQQAERLAELAADRGRHSNVVAQPNPGSSSVQDRTAEVSNLLAKAETLRERTNQLAMQLAERRLQAGMEFFEGESDLMDHNKETGIYFAGGPRAVGKVNDAKAITEALRKYADEHRGEFPLRLDQAAPYLPKPLQADSPPWANAPPTGSNDFEVVYQGSRQDLTNITLRRIALIREREPWQTEKGKWARVYGYVDGAVGTVESDDNFQSWDAQHVIPPPEARR